MSTVNLAAMAERASEVRKEARTKDELGQLKKFRLFSRTELIESLGSSEQADKKLVTRHIAKIEEKLGKSFGQRSANNHVYFTVAECHQILDELIDMAPKYLSKIPRAFRTRRAITMMMTNLKGGTGKTTSAVHLAVALALYQFSRPRILCIDLDPQGQLHEYMDGRLISYESTATLGGVLVGDVEPPEDKSHKQWLLDDVVRPSCVANIDYIPAVPGDKKLESVLAEGFHEGDFNNFDVLKVLDEQIVAPLRDEYDLILIDSGPHANLTVDAGMYAADVLVVPAATRSMDAEATYSYFDEIYEKHKNLAEELGKEDYKAVKLLPVIYKDSRPAARQIKRKYARIVGNENLLPVIKEREAYQQMGGSFNTSYSYQSAADFGSTAFKAVINDWDLVAAAVFDILEGIQDAEEFGGQQ
ncbi:ParA family protein [Aliagarivorans taiwanensis]|uniref:ParA family protein n=1 Tax=Aliagarivorans taiwanensis TaxID=561966 RepID=UPI00042452CF|nr:ParA family protein [Aliagarivorans taiwanensis]